MIRTIMMLALVLTSLAVAPTGAAAQDECSLCAWEESVNAHACAGASFCDTPGEREENQDCSQCEEGAGGTGTCPERCDTMVYMPELRQGVEQGDWNALTGAFSDEMLILNSKRGVVQAMGCGGVQQQWLLTAPQLEQLTQVLEQEGWAAEAVSTDEGVLRQ
jgi:hypothetical protein